MPGVQGRLPTMKGTRVIAWLLSVVGWWRLAQPETDASQCQRAEHPVISYKGEGQAPSEHKGTTDTRFPRSGAENSTGYCSSFCDSCFRHCLKYGQKYQILHARVSCPETDDYDLEKNSKSDSSRVENRIVEATFI